MPRGQRILIVEDDEHLRRILQFALMFAGFDVQEARDGIEALQIIDRSPPDLVVLDIVLPGVDGITVRQEISAHALTRHIPVVIVTGTHINAEQLNVACLLRKPIDPDEVVRTVERCLQAPLPSTA